MFFLQLPHPARLVDEDPIVDDDELDTNANNNQQQQQNDKNSIDEFNIDMPRTYRSVELRKWRQAPEVIENYGKPGERGKPVKIPASMQELAKEKFKENQFNLLASDMIWLNRSLTDVRHVE